MRDAGQDGAAVGEDEAGLTRVAALADVSRETVAPLQSYADLLRKWQRSINLVSRSTLPDLWDRHFADSAQLLPLIRRDAASRTPTILDVGSGAGFPGMVLAALGAGAVNLVESDQRKVSFLRQVVLATGANATLHTARVEELAPFPADIITARAFAPLPRLFDLVADFISDTTVLWLLKGREAEQELTALSEYWTVSVERITSRTDPHAVILRLSDAARTP